MNKTQKYLKVSILILAAFSVLLALLAMGTGSLEWIKAANPVFFGFSAVFFLLSILLWLFSWSLLLVKRHGISLFPALSCGFSSVFGSLTPIQLGSDALRSIFLRERLGISYSDSFSASMIVKGLKFSFLALASFFVATAALFSPKVNPILFLPLLSGLAVVLLASFLFLLPLNPSAGNAIARFFGAISKKIGAFRHLENYFKKYSLYLQKAGKKMLSLIFLLSALSWLCEFLSLYFVFLALGIELPALSLAVFFVLTALLERTPVLPRGILLVEAVGFAFLSFPLINSTGLSLPQTASVLVLFDVSRLLVPVIASLFYYLLFFRRKRARQQNS